MITLPPTLREVPDGLLARAEAKVRRLCAEPRDLVSLWTETTDVLVTAVPHYWTPCYYTLDPAALLITSHFHLGLDEFPIEFLAAEYYDDDVNQIADVARSESGVSTLHDATDGDPSQSPRWHRNMAMGGDQELVARLQTKSGEVWGALGLYRAPGEPMFTAEEKTFVRKIGPALADAARNALLVGQARDPQFPNAPALVVLDRTWVVESATPGADSWLEALCDPSSPPSHLPSAIVAVAARALRIAQSPAPGETAMSRVQARDGTWAVLHASVMMSSGEPRVAVIIEPASPARLYPLLTAVYGLTEREKDVTGLVLQGASTSQIAADLFVSSHTVQQHLKSIFEKTGVRSRRELVGRVFFAHYEPRLRDNERRVLDQQPLRGEPWPAQNSTNSAFVE
jgi:DNA-binding CsgD family transcriptional regulator